MRVSSFKGWLLCLPALTLFLLFFLGPACVGLATSFFAWDGMSASARFVGWSNYVELLSADRFWASMRINMVVVIASLALQTPLGLGLALLLSRPGKGMAFYRNAIFSPQVLSVAAVALIWQLVYDPYQGLLNALVGHAYSWVGLPAPHIAWLGDTDTALISLILVTTWYYTGLSMLLFMAGLASIPKEFLEAARLETSRWSQQLRYVTLPMLREVFLIVFTMTFAGSFGHIIGLFFLMTAGGPAGRTEVVGLYMHSSAFRAFQFGYASAISVIMIFLVLVVVIWPARRMARERLEYG